MDIPELNLDLMVSSDSDGMIGLIVGESIGGPAGRADRFGCSAANFFFGNDGRIHAFSNNPESPRTEVHSGTFRVIMTHPEFIEKLRTPRIIDFFPEGGVPPSAAKNLRRTITLYNALLFKEYVSWYRTHEPKIWDCVCGQTYDLQKDVVYSIGRDRSSTIAITAPTPKSRRWPSESAYRERMARYKTVSGRHASLTIDGDRALIKDLGSTNGTYVFGMPIERGKRQAVERLTVIRLGNYSLFLE